VASLRKRDAGGGALLNELYRDVIFRFCWGYLGKSDEADDAVQDICFKVLKADQIPDNFRPWLYRIARNHCLNLLRGRVRRHTGLPLPPGSQLHVARSGQLTRLAREEMNSRLSEVVGHLPEATQEILRLRYVEELSRVEIADILEMPEKVVKSRLFEGLKKLRDLAARLNESD